MLIISILFLIGLFGFLILDSIVNPYGIGRGILGFFGWFFIIFFSMVSILVIVDYFLKLK